MKLNYHFTLPLLLLIFGCNNQQASYSARAASFGSDSTVNDSIQLKAVKVSNDTAIQNLTKQILSAVKNKDYKQFSSFIHPLLGVRFSPYGFVDTTSDVKLTSDKFLAAIGNRNKITWGNYDGSGAEIFLTAQQYFEKFIYTADFLNAEKISLNTMIGSGNSLNNLETIYKGCDFTESYFSGFDKKFDGMDWCCLRLVFKNYSNKIYLVGVVHDQWTI